MVRVKRVNAGRLRWWNNALWVLLGLWIARGFRHMPVLAAWPGIVAYASAAPLLLMVVKAVATVAGFILGRVRGRRDAAADTFLAIRFGKVEVIWRSQTRKE